MRPRIGIAFETSGSQLIEPFTPSHGYGLSGEQSGLTSPATSTVIPETASGLPTARYPALKAAHSTCRGSRHGSVATLRVAVQPQPIPTESSSPAPFVNRTAVLRKSTGAGSLVPVVVDAVTEMS